RALGGTAVNLPVFAVAGGQVLEARVAWTSDDSATLALGGATIDAEVSAEGEFLGGSVAAQGLTFTRVGAADRPGGTHSSSAAAGVAPATAPTTSDYSAPPGAP